MLAQSMRSDFTFKEPAALTALLGYDWRVRGVLTDNEVLEEAIDQPVSTSVLRHLQRLGVIRATHGVRAQGGRMRLWSLNDVLRVQAILDLRAKSGARLAACVEAFAAHPGLLDETVEGWATHTGCRQDCRAQVAINGGAGALLCDVEVLANFAQASVCSFVGRNDIGRSETPAFLL